MTSPSPQTPPAAQTTAAEPGITDDESEVKPRRPELTHDRSDRKDPRPSTLATQELRLAVAFTGGVSLAVWMGGVARELDLLVQASDRRRVMGQDAVDPTTPDPNPLRRRYRRLVDLVDVQVAIDVLAGTSAGGINAALLGLVNARGLDLGRLRETWLTAGDLAQLLRDPREDAPVSLLKGDGQMLSELNRAIRDILASHPTREVPRKTDVFITATLLSPEISRSSDDYGTQIDDTDHRALFHFNEEMLVRPDIAPPLALAARTSASFPGAFEPSFLGFGEQPGLADPLHPSMSTYANTTRPHWAADGGLLVNRPIAPLLQCIFDREADRDVRRTLLYVVPSGAAVDAAEQDNQDTPLKLAQALLRDLGATLNQSIAADLAAIREHNDRTRAVGDTRLRLAALGSRLPQGELIADAAAWVDYRQRQGSWMVAPLIAEVTRQLQPTWRELGVDLDALMRTAAETEVTRKWPTGPPAGAAAAIEAAASLGRPAVDFAKATLLRMLRLGYAIANTAEERNCLARLTMHAHRALSDPRRTDLREMVNRHLIHVDHETPSLSGIKQAVIELTGEYASAQGDVKQLGEAWLKLCGIINDAVPLLEGLAKEAETGAGNSGGSVSARRAAAALELRPYLRFLCREDTAVQLLDLHIAVRSVLPVLLEVEQPVQLIQVSADTTTSLAPNRLRADEKLTGMQAYHFGAFYKTSWRANDWMWGRLDGCGWLVHMLLDPRRIRTVLENEEIAVGQRATTFAGWLSAAVETPLPPDLYAELAFLDVEGGLLPTSLPRLAIWVAEVLQQHILIEELPVVAAQLRAPGQDTPGPAAVSWLQKFADSDWQRQGLVPGRDLLAELLDTCPVASESLKDEAEQMTPLYLRSVTHATAVGTSAATGIAKPPRSLKPTFATARAVTRAAHLITDRTNGKRRQIVLIGLALVLFGVLSLLTNVSILGLTGVIAFGVAAVLLAFGLGPRTVGVVQLLIALAVVLLAAAPWFPWLDERLFRWLSDTAIPWIDEHNWAWPVLLFLVLLPPVTTILDLVQTSHTRKRRLGRAPGQQP